jgi:hypothetical protein
LDGNPNDNKNKKSPSGCRSEEICAAQTSTENNPAAQTS